MPLFEHHITGNVLDKRVVARRQKQGLVSREEFVAHLENLKDVEKKSSPVAIKVEKGLPIAAARRRLDDDSY